MSNAIRRKEQTLFFFGRLSEAGDETILPCESGGKHTAKMQNMMKKAHKNVRG